MNARSRNFSPRAEAAAAVAAAVLLFSVAWALLHAPFYTAFQIVDTPVYQGYGDAVVAGRVPYRDFAVEYPPGALPVFVLPSLGAAERYGGYFDAVMWLCGAAAVAFCALTLAAAGAARERLYAGAGFTALAPLALGSVVLTRYDLWPAALTAAALAALVAGRERLGLGALALAVAAKLYPLVLLPPALLHVARRSGGRAAASAAAVFALVLAAVFLPFALVASGGLAASFERQAGRPLQIESLGAALLLAADRAGLYDAVVVSSHGSQNLTGPLPDRLAAVQTALQALAVVSVWVVFALGRRGRESLLAASAAAVAAFVAFGKVLSPQFLVWLVPLVPLAAPPAGVTASLLLAAALLLTQGWFPSRYWDLVALEPAPGRLLLARDLVLVVLFAVLALAIRRGREPRRSG